MKLIFTALYLLAATSPAFAASPCVAPTVTSAIVDNVSHDGNLNHYHIAMTISNRTDSSQASNTLQFVDVYHDRQRLDAIGVPPLRSGASYKAFYTFARSSDAGGGTTTLHLPIRMVQPACAAAAVRTITF